MRSLPAVLLPGLLSGLLPAQDKETARYVPVDLAKVERRVTKEPAYVAAPRYAMFVFDLAGAHRVMAVVDKSAKDAPFYDVLYLDLDADGDLTEAGERFAGKRDPNYAGAGMEMSIRVPEIRVPGTALVHKAFLLSTSPKKDRTGFWFRMKWDGKYEMSGGYGSTGIDTTTWSASVAEAKVFRPCPLGPLHFATWGDPVLELKPGAAVHLNVIAGNLGSGPDTLAVVDEFFLDLEKDELTVTVIAKNSKGEEVTETSRIKKHC